MAPIRPADTPWLIVGCGYTGGRLADALVAAGARVIGTRRSAAAAAALVATRPIEAVIADLDRPATLAGLCPDGATVVLAAPPAADPAGEAALMGELGRGGGGGGG
jgi:uncharacterized protein YbjT (DUF2867 family)